MSTPPVTSPNENPSHRPINGEAARYILRWRLERGSTPEDALACAKTATPRFAERISPQSIERLWAAPPARHEMTYEAVRSRLKSSSIDELAAVVKRDAPDDLVFDELRRRMQPYLVGVFAAVNGHRSTTVYQLHFMRQLGVIPPDGRVAEDVCQHVEIEFWKLACNFKLTGGAKFVTHLKKWLGHKVRDAVKDLVAQSKSEVLGLQDSCTGGAGGRDEHEGE